MRMNKQQVIQQLRDIQKKLDLNQQDYAARIGISPAYLSDIYLDRRDPGPTVLNFLNLEEKTIYEKKKDD